MGEVHVSLSEKLDPLKVDVVSVLPDVELDDVSDVSFCAVCIRVKPNSSQSCVESSTGSGLCGVCGNSRPLRSLEGWKNSGPIYC